MKKLLATLISHRINLFGSKFILGLSYNPDAGVKYSTKSWNMSNVVISLGLFTIAFSFSHDGVHDIDFTCTLTPTYREDKINIDFQNQYLQHEWYEKRNGNREYKYSTLHSWWKENKFGTRIKKV